MGSASPSLAVISPALPPDLAASRRGTSWIDDEHTYGEGVGAQFSVPVQRAAAALLRLGKLMNGWIDGRIEELMD